MLALGRRALRSLAVAGCLAVGPVPAAAVPVDTVDLTLNPSSGTEGTLVLVTLHLAGTPARCGRRAASVSWDDTAVGTALLDLGYAAARLPAPVRGAAAGPHLVRVAVSGVRGTASAVFHVIADRAAEPG